MILNIRMPTAAQMSSLIKRRTEAFTWAWQSTPLILETRFSAAVRGICRGGDARQHRTSKHWWPVSSIYLRSLMPMLFRAMRTCWPFAGLIWPCPKQTFIWRSRRRLYCWTETLPMHSILKRNSCQEYRYLGTPYIILRGSCISIHIQLYYIPISETKGVSQTLVEGN